MVRVVYHARHDRVLMEPWKRVYSDQQRNALRYVFFVKGITNMAQIGRLANAGELVFEGRDIPAFPIPAASVRDIINQEKRKRLGKQHSDLVAKPPGDAVETLRRRLTSILDHETARLEKWQEKNTKTPVDAEQIRKLARAVRELDALPGPGERSTKTAPGRGAQQGNGGEAPAKPNTLAGTLAAALKPGAINPERNAATEDVPPDHNEHRDKQPQNTGIATRLKEVSYQPTKQTTSTTDHNDTDDPGAFARDGLAGLRALDVSVTRP